MQKKFTNAIFTRFLSPKTSTDLIKSDIHLLLITNINLVENYSVGQLVDTSLTILISFVSNTHLSHFSSLSTLKDVEQTSCRSEEFVKGLYLLHFEGSLFSKGMAWWIQIGMNCWSEVLVDSHSGTKHLKYENQWPL